MKGITIKLSPIECIEIRWGLRLILTKRYLTLSERMRIEELHERIGEEIGKSNGVEPKITLNDLL